MSIDQRFAGMTVLVTGASSGIGAQAAVAFGSRGGYTFIHCNRNTDGAKEVLGKVRQAGGDGAILAADLSAAAGIQQLVQLVEEAGSPPDILINNAGSLIKRTPVLDFTPELWSQVFTLNLTSAFFLAQALLPAMLARGRGFIVNVSSVAARNGGGIGALAYASSKGAVSTMTKALAKEFAGKGIRVNAVSPGTIDTNYHKNFSTTQALETVAAITPMGRLGTPEEVADLIVFLCSEEARFIQGQVIEVNGGYLMV
jgi:3-oxoacyl-[acyl-carrier protein] reductase